ncbi:MAG TPA: PLP-dependent aminotransferase family protein [Mycobacteriales bacterium]|nr:PLP-dependent aminotransferase family protein [Mycobacteriales bacterium]
MADLDRLVRQLQPSLGRRSAYLDLADALRALILDGQLLVGDRLPPQRTLATALELSRTTVVASLNRLHAEGYLSSRQGSGTTVRLPADRTDRPDEPAGGRRPDLDLSMAVLPAPRQVAAAAVRAAERLPEFLTGAGLEPFGLVPLRAAIAARFAARGLPTAPDQVLVTQGALHGWDLVLRAYARPAGGVLVEQPSYPAAMDAVRAHRARPQPVGVSAEGWQWPGRLPAADVAYVVPDFQNPTGHLAGAAERRALARRLRGPLLCVDETFVELGDGPAVVPAGAAARDAVTIGSLSKLVWAGVRVGWLRGPRDTLNRIAAGRSSQDIGSPVLDQLLALELMGELDAIRDERRALLRARRAHAVSTVRAAGWEVAEPAGGMFLWVDLGGLSSTRLSAAARALGVRVPPGTRFSTSRTHDRYLRLPFTLPSAQLAEAVRRLQRAATADSTPRTAPAAAIWTV